jgi:hypothetical protein
MSQRAELAEISPESARFGAYREGVRDAALKLTGGAGLPLSRTAQQALFALFGTTGYGAIGRRVRSMV